MRRIFVLDASNISALSNQMVRTGIQEVVYQTATALVEVKENFPDVQFFTLPFLPRRASASFHSERIVSHPQVGPGILEQIEDGLRTPSREIWGLDLRGRGFTIDDNSLWDILNRAEILHIQSLVNMAPLIERIKASSTEASRRLRSSVTIYDLIPILVPEYCNSSVSRWYSRHYLPSLARYIDHAVCISRNTALDLVSLPLARKIPKVTTLSLPFDYPQGSGRADELIKKHGLTRDEFVLFVGSLEPRKNFTGLLEGFERYRANESDSKMKLVLVGSTGWKNNAIERKMKSSPFVNDIVRTGYLGDDDLNALIEAAGAVAMLSHYEGYGLPVAQAYCKGTPVITTLGTSLPEACNGDGIFVTASDPNSIAAGIWIARMKNLGKGEREIPGEVSGRNWKAYTRSLVELLLGEG
jgi:glycosyltransferase involved in cell wall biosynthesis